MDYSPEEEEIGEDDQDLKEFIAKSTLSQKYIRDINTLTNILLQVKDEYPKAVEDAQKNLNNTVNNSIEKFSLTQQKCKAVINQIQETIKLTREDDPKLEKPESRIKLNMSGCIIKDFGDSVEKFQAKQAEIKQVMTKSTVRDAEVLLGRKLNEKETNDIIEDPAVINTFLSVNIESSRNVFKINRSWSYKVKKCSC